MDGKIKLAIIACVIAAGVSYYLGNFNKSIALHQNSYDERESEINSPDMALSSYTKAVLSLKQIGDLLESRDFHKAYAIFESASDTVAMMTRKFPEVLTPEHKTIKDDFNAHIDSLTVHLKDYMIRQMSAVAEGDLHPRYLKEFKSSFDTFAFKALQEEYRKLEPEFILKRQKNAAHWIRIYVHGDSEKWNDVIEDAIKQRIQTKIPLKLVWGWSFGNDERYCPKYFEVSIALKKERYEFEAKKLKHNTIPEIPYHLTLKIIAREKDGIPSNWDQLKPIIVEAPVPEKLFVTLDRGQTHVSVSVDKIIQDAEATMSKNLNTALLDLESLRFFPDINLDNMSLTDSEGHLQSQYVHPFYLMDQNGFRESVKQGLQYVNEKDTAAWINLILNYDLIEHADWVGQTLRKSDVYVHERILLAFKKRPDFLEWKLALQLLDSPSSQIANAAFDATRRVLNKNPHIKNVFLERALDTHGKQRIQYAREYLIALDVSDVFAHSEWVLDSSIDFAVNYFHVVKNKDTHLAKKIVFQYFDTVNDFVKQAMIDKFPYAFETCNDQDLEFMRTLLSNPAYKKITDTLFGSLSYINRSVDIFSFLQSIENLETFDAIQKQSVVQMMLQSAVKYKSPVKTQFIKDKLQALKNTPMVEARGNFIPLGVTGEAISAYYEVLDDKKMAMHYFYELMNQVPEDPLFTYRLFKILNKYCFKRDFPWNEGITKELFKTGLQLQDADVTKNIREMIKWAVEKNFQGWDF